MKERGFMPFSAAGVVIVLLVLGMVGHAAWSRHQRSMSLAADVSSSALLAVAAEIQCDLRAAAKYAVYRALWEVSKRASDYSGAARECAIEQLATGYFVKRVKELGPAYAWHDARVELEIPNSSSWPALDLKETVGGYALAEAGLPKGTRIKLNSRDNSLSLVQPLDENFEVFIDSRYFLLQERMGEFVERRGDIGTWWGIMEYASAWAGAWLSGKVELSDSRSRAFFETAWAIHEFNTFGSSDYWAAAEGLMDAAGGDGGNLLSELHDRSIVVTPIRAAGVDNMRDYIGRSLGAIGDAATYLVEAERCVRSAKYEATHASENVEGVLENIRELLGDAIENIARARGKISEASEQFGRLLEFTSNSSSNDVVMKTLHQSLTSRVLNEDYPSLQEQVGWGVKGALEKLLEIERAITNASAELEVSELETLLGELSEHVESSITRLLSEPTPERWIKFTSYDGNLAQPTEERIPVYLEDEAGGTIGLLKLVLEGAKSNLDEMERFSQQLEPAPDELQEFEFDEGLKSKIKTSPPEFVTDRERSYELLPPPPIRASPGLSVFHEFDVKSVTYKREDPAGLFNLPTPTPIPLWFIGVTLWWGQWEVTVELEEGAIEEVFDFDNPTLPLVHGVGYVHKPLAYRWKMPHEPFGIRVAVISLRPFEISGG